MAKVGSSLHDHERFVARNTKRKSQRVSKEEERVQDPEYVTCDWGRWLCLGDGHNHHSIGNTGVMPNKFT